MGGRTYQGSPDLSNKPVTVGGSHMESKTPRSTTVTTVDLICMHVLLFMFKIYF